MKSFDAAAAEGYRWLERTEHQGQGRMHKSNRLSADLANCMSALNDQRQEHENHE
ncbi:MAG: hypothetical protein WCP28_19420 [Actinomycetes bacterium]